VNVTRQELGDRNTRVVADGVDLVMERVFAAPRELVWAAMTSPRHIPHWWGLRGTTATVFEMDVSPGGRWRIGSSEVSFQGEYLEVDPPARLVRTSIPVGIPDIDTDAPPVVETITFTTVDGGTRLYWHARFPSAEVLDFALAQGMTTGILDQFERLAELLPGLA
jgi:uncharacterized protein YndB with AHSA1/START domain